MRNVPHDLEEFSSELDPMQQMAVLEPTRLSRGRRIVGVLTGFVFGQGAAQGLNILAGMFLVRKLSIESYAQFGLAYGFQTVFAVLMDLGFASTIIPLVGDRRQDKKLIGRYVRSAKHLRDRTFLYLAPVASIAFVGLMYRHHWSWQVQTLLLGSVLVSLYSGGKVAYFSAPLFVFGRLREYYVPQIFSTGGRLVAYVAMALSGGLNAWTAAGVSALNVTLNGALIRRASTRYMVWPEREDTATDKEMLDYILPASPAIIFSAFQSQISLFLISFFGGTQNIAEVTALGRIGQLFAVLMTFNVIVVEPYIARQPREGLLRKFVRFMTLGALGCAPLVALAFWRPQIFVWVLGQKYDGLNAVMGWYVLSASIGFLSGLLWIMNRARKWVFWSGSVLEVALLIGGQVLYAALVGISTTRQAVMLAIVSGCCMLLSHLYNATVGFLKGARLKQKGLTEQPAG